MDPNTASTTETGAPTAPAGSLEALLTGAATPAAPAPAPAAADQAGQAGDPPAASAPAGDAWWKDLAISADKPDRDTLSDAEWMINKGYADMPSVIKAMRGLESKVGQTGLAIPGDTATPEEHEAFFKALGRPDDPEGYGSAEVPEGEELDTTLFEGMRQAAFEAGIPKAMFEKTAAALIKLQVQQEQDWQEQERTAAHAVIQEWGPEANANTVRMQQATRALMETYGWEKKDFMAIAASIGSAKWMKLAAGLGAGLAEDALINPNGGERKFGVTKEQAAERLKQIDLDPKTATAMQENGPEWQRIKAERKMLQRAAAGA